MRRQEEARLRKEKREQHLVDVQKRRQEQEEAEQQKFYDEVFPLSFLSFPFPSISHHFLFFHSSYRKFANKKRPGLRKKKERSIWKTSKVRGSKKKRLKKRNFTSRRPGGKRRQG